MVPRRSVLTFLGSKPMNTDFFNIHDIILIMAIAVIIHIFAQPLYDRIDGTTKEA